MPEKAGKAERVFKLRDGLRIHSLPLVGQSKVPSRYREARIQLECFLALLDRLDVLTRMVKAVCPACIYDERERIKLLCSLVPVIPSLQVKLICLSVLRVMFCKPLLFFPAQLQPQLL